MENKYTFYAVESTNGKSFYGRRRDAVRHYNRIKSGQFKTVVLKEIPQEELVRELAYKKWEDAQRPEGRDLHFWLEAKQELGVN